MCQKFIGSHIIEDIHNNSKAEKCSIYNIFFKNKLENLSLQYTKVNYKNLRNCLI